MPSQTALNNQKHDAHTSGKREVETLLAPQKVFAQPRQLSLVLSTRKEVGGAACFCQTLCVMAATKRKTNEMSDGRTTNRRKTNMNLTLLPEVVEMLSWFSRLMGDDPMKAGLLIAELRHHLVDLKYTPEDIERVLFSEIIPEIDNDLKLLSDSLKFMRDNHWQT